MAASHQGGACAAEIIYADRDIRSTPALAWPAWVQGPSSGGHVCRKRRAVLHGDRGRRNPVGRATPPCRAIGVHSFVNLCAGRLNGPLEGIVMGPSVNARAASLVSQLIARADEFRISVAKGAARRNADRRRGGLRRRRIGGASAGGNLHGRIGRRFVVFRRRDAALAVVGGGAVIEPGDRLPCEPICGLAPGARRRAGTPISRWGPVRRAHWRARRRCLPNLPMRTPRRKASW